MQSFPDFTYERPNIDAVKAELRYAIKQFNAATTVPMQDECLQEINRQRNDFESMASLAHICYTLNTQDPFYTAEQDYFDEAQPQYLEIVTEYYQALVASPFQKELSKRWGSQLFSIAAMTLKTFSPAVMQDLQQENKLGSRYKQLMASAMIMFDGEERNLPQLAAYQQSPDRATRMEASAARYSFFAQHQNEFDELFDQLVKVRTRIAQTLGFATFTPLGYLRSNRSDYDAQMVAFFRNQVKQFVVPLASQLLEDQQQRLGLDALHYYDESLFFPAGNPSPQGTPEEILQHGRTMYEELSSQTGTFFKELSERELLDLLSRKGKATGGYCDYLAKFSAPFIFANFNGTSGDIDVLTHEAGHAFQVWLSREQTVPEYYFATMEAAEIPSMGMEFFTWPWMERFFGTQASHYRYLHLTSSMLFLPYGCLVDEFQHEVYDHPNMSPQERRLTWRQLEQTYLPKRDYQGHEFLEAGGYWFQQGHIFEVPFYYIDYVLAQTCVFQLWQHAQSDREHAWEKYLSLCRAGGRESFTNLLPIAGLQSPFAEGTVAQMTDGVRAWLQNTNNRV